MLGLGNIGCQVLLEKGLKNIACVSVGNSFSRSIVECLHDAARKVGFHFERVAGKLVIWQRDRADWEVAAITAQAGGRVDD